MNEKICAVVVTYNRLQYLKRLITCLQNQSYPLTDIIVVNNGSTDGTGDWLYTQHVITINQVNTGSSGGFYSGLEYAVKGDYDYIWIMDDDGYPEKNCLEKLVSSTAKMNFGNNAVLCSLIIDPENTAELSFHLPDLKSKYSKLFDHYSRQTDKVSDILAYDDPNGYPWGFFFNSVLLPVPIIKKAGLPKKEFFIWGDEVEYFYRIRKNDFEIFMVPDSIFYHPKLFMSKAAKWKEKYGTRNYVYIHRLYKPLPVIHHVFSLLKIIIERKFYLLPPFYHGLKGDFSKRYHDS